jgi:hypothetical protein
MNKKRNIADWQKHLEKLGIEGLVKNIPIILVVMGFFILNIFIVHYTENTIRDLNEKSTELKQLRWHYIDQKSKLMYMTKESELAKRAVDQGLDVLLSPPSKIEVNAKNEVGQ